MQSWFSRRLQFGNGPVQTELWLLKQLAKYLTARTPNAEWLQYLNSKSMPMLSRWHIPKARTLQMCNQILIMFMQFLPSPDSVVQENTGVAL